MSRSTLGNTAEIAEMIQALTKKTNTLDKMLSKIGSSGDTADFRQTLARTRQEGKELCKRILDALRAAQSRNTHNQDQLAVLKKMSKQFEVVGSKFKQQAEEIERKEQVIVDVMSHSVKGGGYKPLEESGRAVGRGVMNAPQLQQEQEQEPIYQQYDLAEVKRRAEGIRAIERDVSELADMFVDLHSLVVEQGELINRIDDNVSNARDETEGATQQLIQAEQHQKTARKRQCCLLFLVLAIVTAVVLGGVFIFKK